MFRKTLLFFFVFFLISNKFVGSVQAATTDKQTWRCLKATQDGGKSQTPPPDVDIVLTGSGLPSNFPIYIVMTVPPKSKAGETPDQSRTIQSTGNGDFDQKIFNLSDANKNQYVDKLAALGLEVKVPFDATGANQTVQTTDGNLSVKIHLKNADGHVNYAFFAVTINEPTNSGPTLASNQTGNTLQYGTFNFTSADNGDPQKCISIRWDPYGRVFDSVSLEPMLGVKVTLLDENKELVNGTDVALVNPQKTETDGMFNFPVPSGTYYLGVVPPVTHLFVADPHLDPNYTKAYSNLYKPDRKIVEKEGQVKQKDVPLDPGTNSPYHSTIQMMSYNVVNLGTDTKFEGYVSHPLSIVKLVGAQSGNIYKTVNADEFGAWEVVIPNASLPSNEAINLVPSKVDITKLAGVPKFLQNLTRYLGFLTNKLSIEVNAQTVGEGEGKAVSVQPILTYVEGYAYNGNGTIIPNATVRVKVTWSGQTYYETKADQTGFFTIGPSNVPNFAYFLEFRSPLSSVVTVMNTSDFVSKNSKYLSENKINLMAATKNGQSLIPSPTSVPPSPTVTSNNPLTAGTSQMSLILTLVILLVLFAIAGAVLMYIKKKELPPNQSSPMN